MRFYYVYILYSSRDRKFYIGFTENLEKRYSEHKQGKVFSNASRLPIELIFYEAYKNKYDALRNEQYLKSSKGKTTIKTMLKEFINKSISPEPFRS